MKSKIWVISWFVVVLAILGIMIAAVYIVDPYMHYHKPDTNSYFYTLDNERSQNDGITKHFEYDAVITGTSMTENFRASEVNSLFGVNAIKVPYSGGTYKEINDNLKNALSGDNDVKLVIRGLDYYMILDDKDRMRTDLGAYPDYLYDDNIFNDVKYIFNKDILFTRVYTMTSNKDKTGITDFDEYMTWQKDFTFGIKSVAPDGVKSTITDQTEILYLTEEDKETIRGNITQNVTSLADENKDVEFYYFFSPYSAVWWNSINNKGNLERWIEAEEYIIELILEHDNIHLFSFNGRTDITTDINNYKDITHYGQWISTMILKWMKNGQYELTKDNYKSYIANELYFYETFDFESLNSQVDYEADYYIAALLNQEMNPSDPVNLLSSNICKIELKNADYVEDQYQGTVGIKCTGTSQREVGSKQPFSEYLLEGDYVGAKITIDELEEYNYLVFYGKKEAKHGQPTAYVYNDNNELIDQVSVNYRNLDNEWHQYSLDLSAIEGAATIILNGGYVDNSGNENSSFTFSNIILY